MTINRRNFSLSLGSAILAGMTPLTSFAKGEKIILGQSAPFTGPAAELGIQYHAGAKLYFDEVNSKGGVNGRTIEIIKMDDAYDPTKCAENTKKLIDQKVFALFGYVGTPTSLAAMPIFNEAKVPFFAPFTGAMGLREPVNPLIFNVRASYNDETERITRHIRKLMKEKKVSVFYQNDAYGKAGLDGMIKALGAVGQKPLSLGTVERNTVDVAAAVKSILAAKPEVIVQIGAYKACAEFIRQAKKAGYNGNFYNISFVGTTALSEELGVEGSGVYVSQVMPSPYTDVHGVSRDFKAAIAAGGNKVEKNYSSIEGYIAARVFVEGLSRIGADAPLTRESLITILENMGSVSLSGFKVQFSNRNHTGSVFTQITTLTKDSEVVSSSS